MTATPPEDNGQHGQQPPYGQGQQQPQYGQGQQQPQYGQGHQQPQYGQGQQQQYGQGQHHPGQGGPWQQPPQYGAQPPQWGQQPPGYSPPPPMRPEDQRLWATLLHIGGIFFTVIVPIVGYLVLRDRGQFVREHARTTLNFHITMLIAYVIGGITSWLGIGLLIIFGVWILTIVFAIMGAVAANDGRFYKYPLSIEFVKH